MKIPFTVLERMDDVSIDIWRRVYASSRGTANDKTVEESLWRRTQDFRNAAESGWKNSGDKRRKVVYYAHSYDLLRTEVGRPYIALISTYLYICLTLPHNEAYGYIDRIKMSILEGGWTKELSSISNAHAYTKGDLILEHRLYQDPYTHDMEYDKFPAGYVSIETSIRSRNVIVNQDLIRKPWLVLKSGLRHKQARGNPRYSRNIQEILSYLPAQVELGCGPSYEAGVPPLHYLHQLYSINEPFSKKFIMNAEHDTFIFDVIADPSRKYKALVDIFAKVLTAPLTDTYYSLKWLYDNKYVVGPIVTNNFDGLHLRLGLTEYFVRKYEENVIVPDINFDQRARSLLVVGSHADRRRIQVRARRNGLKVIYVDPEGWWTNGLFLKYPLESVQDADIVYRDTATSFFNRLFAHLNNKKGHEHYK